MNDRILELLKQAHEIHYSNNMAWEDVNYEKFAELIIQQCTDILMKPSYAMNNPEKLSEYNQGWVRGRLLGIEHIKKHFEIE